MSLELLLKSQNYQYLEIQKVIDKDWLVKVFNQQGFEETQKCLQKIKELYDSNSFRYLTLHGVLDNKWLVANTHHLNLETKQDYLEKIKSLYDTATALCQSISMEKRVNVDWLIASVYESSFEQVKKLLEEAKPLFESAVFQSLYQQGVLDFEWLITKLEHEDGETLYDQLEKIKDLYNSELFQAPLRQGMITKRWLAVNLFLDDFNIVQRKVECINNILGLYHYLSKHIHYDKNTNFRFDSTEYKTEQDFLDIETKLKNAKDFYDSSSFQYLSAKDIISKKWLSKQLSVRTNFKELKEKLEVIRNIYDSPAFQFFYAKGKIKLKNLLNLADRPWQELIYPAQQQSKDFFADNLPPSEKHEYFSELSYNNSMAEYYLTEVIAPSHGLIEDITKKIATESLTYSFFKPAKAIREQHIEEQQSWWCTLL